MKIALFSITIFQNSYGSWHALNSKVTLFSFEWFNTLYFEFSQSTSSTPLSGNWYKIENFICEPNTGDSDCLQISLDFYITVDLSYDRQLFTVEDFLQSLNFKFKVTYSDVESYKIITVPSNIINSPDNTTKQISKSLDFNIQELCFE